MVKQLYSICNHVWQNEKIPEEWTKSIIVTLPKKGDLTDCSNYRTLSLINHMCKVFLLILLERLKARTEVHLSEEQAGFRKDRSTVQQILTLRLIAENTLSKQDKTTHNCFIDFKKAFDSIDHKVIWAVLESFGIEQKLIHLLKEIYLSAKAAVRIGNDTGNWFKQEVGSRQGDPLSPTIFTIYLERILQNMQEEMPGVSIHGTRVNNLRFADDIDLIEADREQLQTSLTVVYEDSKKAGLVIHPGKTKVLVFGN